MELCARETLAYGELIERPCMALSSCTTARSQDIVFPSCNHTVMIVIQSHIPVLEAIVILIHTMSGVNLRPVRLSVSFFNKHACEAATS